MGIYKYQVGGSLTAESPSYVTRQADLQLYQYLQQNEFCYVLNSRQMGKSSLLVRTKHQLQQEGFRCSHIDLTRIGSNYLTPEHWYKGIVGELWRGFQLLEKVELKSWWWESGNIPIVQKLSYFIEDILLVQFPHERIVIFVDEIDKVTNLDFCVDDFFALIRFCYNQRANNQAYCRLTFALFGVATPTDLIKNKKNTPFNIGKAIELPGFTINQISPLIKGLEDKVNNPQAILIEILYWTGGQPFLTQKLCQLVISDWQQLPTDQFRQISTNEFKYITALVKSKIIHNWEYQDEPEHLRTIRDRLLQNGQCANRVLGIYQQILTGYSIHNSTRIKTVYALEHLELLLSGLVINQQGYLQVKNKIYQAIFNFQWVEEQLSKLRPYTTNLQAWLASQQQDISQLLQGLDLKEALAWTENKQLSDLDYRFLSASQKQAQQEVESDLAAAEKERKKALFAMDTAQKAQLVLIKAHQTAKQTAKQIRLNIGWLGAIPTLVTFLILLFSSTGYLQGIEWLVLDYFFQQRPQAKIDDKITIITINETDIKQIGQLTLSDRVLAQALNRLASHNPRVVGLDLYRDLPVEPGHQELVQTLQNNSNIIGIEKIVGVKVDPPPILAKNQQVGFADLIIDEDGTVRRALLSMQNKEGNIYGSLALKLALNYLEAEGIQPQFSSANPSQIQLGKNQLTPLQKNDAGYVNADTGGYQILLDYRGKLDKFNSFSLTELLTGNVPQTAIKDRVILIGANVATLVNLYPTPYSSWNNGSAEQMAPVTIHANIVSQLLTSAMVEKGTLRGVSQTSEWLWMLFWCGFAGFWCWYLYNAWLKAIAVVLTLITVITITYFLFLQGWWLPIVPIVLGIFVSAIAMEIFNLRKYQRLQLQQVLKILRLISQKQPAVAQIALEYLKQSESKENKLLIEKQVIDFL